MPHLPAGLPLPLLAYARLRLGWLLWLAGSGFCLNWPTRSPHNLEGCPPRRGQIANLLPLIQGRCLVAGDSNSQARDNCLREEWAGDFLLSPLCRPCASTTSGTVPNGTAATTCRFMPFST